MRSETGIDTSVPVVVLKMMRDYLGHGRLGAVRSLGRLGVPVYFLHESREPQDVWAYRSYRRAEHLTARRRFGSVRRADEAAWFARDAVAFFAMAGFLAARPVHERIARNRRGKRVLQRLVGAQPRAS